MSFAFLPILAQTPAGFGSGEAALTATGLLFLLIGIVGFFLREKLKEVESLKARVNALEREVIGKDKLELALDRIEGRIFVLEKEAAVTASGRVVERVQKLETDVGEIKGGIRSLGEKLLSLGEKADLILDWIRSQSGETPLHFHSREGDRRGGRRSSDPHGEEKKT